MRLSHRYAVALGLFAVSLFGTGSRIAGQPPTAAAKPQWIWTEEATVQNAPDGIRFFRKLFKVEAAPAEANLQITADNSYRIWINGSEVGSGNQWNTFSSYPVGKLLQVGDNAIAVEARNEGVSPAGLLVQLRIKSKDKTISVLSDNSWKTAKEAPKEWLKPAFDDARWGKAKALAALGDAPWGNLGVVPAGASKPNSFTVPEGFKVEKIVGPAIDLRDGKSAGVAPFRLSLVNMCFDSRGRIFVSQENGPVLLCTDPNKAGECQKFGIYCDQVKNCQGMCWIEGALYLAGNGPKGIVGLYRCRDTKDADCIDEVELIARCNGGMGDHGPHAILQGPDRKLYFVLGNHTHLIVNQPLPRSNAIAYSTLALQRRPWDMLGDSSYFLTTPKLAVDSPLTRWPTGQQAPDQGQPGTTEDVLLKRQNDAGGHAANIRAPGGTIWRIDLDGKNPALVAAGFRNQFDAAFNADGEIFSFDSDMEWDENLPWYRPVRVCHVPIGAEFGWRTGSSKIPPYAEDTLPGIYNTGRGSPTGVTFYQGTAFPPKYRGAFFMCDWSIGVLWAVHLRRDGASYRAETEKFCTGAPMPISDCVAGPDGALYFCLGGRNTQGGVFRIAATETPTTSFIPPQSIPQRWTAIRRLGYEPSKNAGKELLAALKDADPFVQRVACESLIRLGIEPPVQDLKPLLLSDDHFLRNAARLVLQRIDPKKWADGFIGDASDRLAQEAVIALCKIDKAAPYADSIFDRLQKPNSRRTPEQMLEWLRTIQLAMVHTSSAARSLHPIAQQCYELFPQGDAMVNRELAVLLAEFARTGVLEQGVIPKLLAAMKDARSDRPQRIHYYYCLRVIKKGWTAAEKADLLAWYDGTKTWTGGASYSRYLENFLREMQDVFTRDDRNAILSEVEKYPLAATVMLKIAPADQLPTTRRLGDLFALLVRTPGLPRANEMREAIVDALGKIPGLDAERELRIIADVDPAQRAAVGKVLSKTSSPGNFPYVVRVLDGANGGTLVDLLNVLLKNPAKPKPDDGAAFRSLLSASTKVEDKQRWKVVQVLRHWTGDKQFGAKEGDWKTELASWGKWFNQSYPMQQALPDLAGDRPIPSKYRYDDLLAYLMTDPQGRQGNPAKGKLAFTKAQCIKCHRFGNEGEGLGPDLTAVSKRFKRGEILESIFDPSKVISDQYRSTKITLFDGKSYNGLMAPQGDVITMLLQDGTKAVIKESDVEQRIASLISVMPEKLLDELTKEEIADLFAFLESEAKK